MGANDISGAGSVTATTFSGDLNGTINTATTATTQTAADNSTKIATTAYADAASTDDQTAAEVVSTATANIAALTVQTALAELDAEKLALAGGEMSGNITMGANDISGAGSVTATTFSGDLNGTINTATTATTQTAADNSTKIATTAYADAASTDDQTAAEVVSTATANIAALTVQTALAELDAEKLALAGGEMSGNITMGANDISGAGSVTATTFSGDLNGTINTATTATTQTAADNSTKIATTAYADAASTDDQTAAEVVSTATANIAALTVQTALAELDAEKLALAGGEMSGNITMGANDISGAGSVTATTFSGDLNGTINTATTATTQTAADNSTKIATTAYADAASTDDQTAAEVVSTATANIAALTVQTALAELDAEKLALAGGEMSGNITMGANDISGAGSVTATTFSGDLNGTINTATTATTQTAADNSTKIATTAYADAASTDDQTAAEVVSTATANIAALTVQTALAELDAEKLALAGGEMSGNITMGANDISGAGSVTATTFSGDLNGTINTATTATTQTAADNSTKIATTAYADAASTDDQTAAEVVSTATANIAALTVQTALAELDAEKLALAGGEMSGNITMGANDISGAGSVTATTFSGNLIGNILDSNENELVKGTTTTDAINEITITNAATGNGPTISASGGDTNVDLNIEAKGTGVVNTTGDLTVGGTVTTNGLNDSNNGSNINTAGGDTTIDSMSGRFRILSGFDTDVIISNSFVTSNSIVICTITSANINGTFIQSAIPSNGSFTVTIDAGVGYDLDINFLIIN